MQQKNRSSAERLKQLVQQATSHLTDAQVPHIEAFVQHYFSHVAPDDIAAYQLDYLVRLVVQHFKWMYRRQSSEVRVAITHFSADVSTRGLPFSAIMIVHRDMPFLIDSVRMAVNQHGYMAHWVIDLGGIAVLRDKKGVMQAIVSRDDTREGVFVDAPIYIALDRRLSDQQAQQLQAELIRVLGDVSCAVDDWGKMHQRLERVVDDLSKYLTKRPNDIEGKSSIAFLRWLPSHFIFLGSRYYQLRRVKGVDVLRSQPRSGLGVLRRLNTAITKPYAQLPLEVRDFAQSSRFLIFSKTKNRSTVHRPSYTDFIGVKDLDASGNVIGEHHFIGLYTSSAYSKDPSNIPLLSGKIDAIMARAHFAKHSYAAHKLLHIVKNLPRDDLFQASTEDLLKSALFVLGLERQERRKISLWIRKDAYDRFFSCFIYMPKDYFSSQLLHKMQDLLRHRFKAVDIKFSTYFSDAPLMRIHYVVYVRPEALPTLDQPALEEALTELAYPWKDRFLDALRKRFGSALGETLFDRYQTAFQEGYCEAFCAEKAARDVGYLEILGEEQPVQSLFYTPDVPATSDIQLRLKLFHLGYDVSLSNVLPMLGNMGIGVVNACTYRAIKPTGKVIWITDFGLVPKAATLLADHAKQALFKEAFHQIYRGSAESDGFNHLILTAGLSWRKVMVLRAYASYFRQIRFPFSFEYIQRALLVNVALSRLLMKYFSLRFSVHRKRSETALRHLEKQFLGQLVSVENPDEDRILRYYLAAMTATLRTNYYQYSSDGGYKRYLALKLDPAQLQDIPRPVPWCEMFVYDSDFEGTHLRMAKVARGGIRWSDRKEDFRTEILGLAKAQHVKNAIIVPAGAKGGFVLKCTMETQDREALQQAGRTYYKLFISGLLDLVDNRVADQVVKPHRTICYDEDDAYLVVAADKGTAIFSDTANQIAIESYQFWLRDAFATGGRHGYDHKIMGITSRGAWQSVLHHFHGLGMDINKQTFTVIGIGDMSGDVFGNGMLLSKNIRLVGAFNHRHIFIDPDPDPKVSYAERQRLFKMPGSAWSDYQKACLSKGGGVFSRRAKSITLTKPIKTLLGITQKTITPKALIRHLLQAPVDLLWNGGIGTYVKASSETHEMVGDRANDAVRVDGKQLRCRIVVEGGNLGLTQLARGEYELKGGLINTDFIDNSAGVDCSDHEVNTKILLDTLVQSGQLSEAKRNRLLRQLEKEVAQLVCCHNRQQNTAISLTASKTAGYLSLYDRYIREQAQQGHFDRALAYLPSSDTLRERKASGHGLMRSEIAILLTRAKLSLKQAILDSAVLELPYFASYMQEAFPAVLSQRYPRAMANHPLRREIIATQLSSSLVNDMGIVFVHQMRDEMGVGIAPIICAYAIANTVCRGVDYSTSIDALKQKINTETRMHMMHKVDGLIRRSARWLLRNRCHQLEDVEAQIDYFKDQVGMVHAQLADHLTGVEKEQYVACARDLVKRRVPRKLAYQIAALPALHFAFPIINATLVVGDSLDVVIRMYSPLIEDLQLTWLRRGINAYPLGDRWTVLARAALKNDLDRCIQSLLQVVLRCGSRQDTPDIRLNNWFEHAQNFVSRWQQMIETFKAAPQIDFLMLTVAVRDLAEYLSSAQPICKGSKE